MLCIGNKLNKMKKKKKKKKKKRREKGDYCDSLHYSSR